MVEHIQPGIPPCSKAYVWIFKLIWSVMLKFYSALYVVVVVVVCGEGMDRFGFFFKFVSCGEEKK